MACTILIFLFVYDELSYENSHEKAGNIYRITTQASIQGNEMNLTSTPVPMGPTLKEEFPFVKNFVRLKGGWPMSIKCGEDTYNEDRFFFADSNITEVFTIPFVKGNPKTALTRPNTVVITESIAEKYFGTEDPIGRKLEGENDVVVEITGIIKDPPANTHFKYDFLASFTSYWNHEDQFFMNIDCKTYILCEDGYDHTNFGKDFELIIEKYMSPQLEQFLGTSFEDFVGEGTGNSWEHHLQPLKDIHLKSHLEDEIEANSDIKYVYIFGIIAIIILVIACINFMNLSTARAMSRAKEVGVRKVTGAGKGQLVFQFMGESVMLAFFAHILAMILMESFLPAFNNFTGKEMSFQYGDPRFYLGLIVIILFVGLLAGSYPAFVLSSFNPVSVLKVKLGNGHGRSYLRSALVVFQFSISIVIILGTLIVNRQLKYMSRMDLGYESDQVLVVEKAYLLVPNHETFKQELEKYKSVESVTITSALPGYIHSGTGLYSEGKTIDQLTFLNVGTADEDYLNTMGIELLEGRFMSEAFNDSFSVVLNEAAVKIFNFEDPVGKRLYYASGQHAATVIGVVQNFNFESLHSEIRPLGIFTGNFNSIAIKVRADNLPQTIRHIRNTWSKMTDKSFDYYFLDDRFNEMYDKEIKTGVIFSVFSGLAIVIALLGLIGLVSYATEQRTKEVGIRKSLGATSARIVKLFSQQTVFLLLIANFIAWPVAYIIMDRWLQDFAYRTNINLAHFVLVLVVTILLSLITIGYQSVRTARRNPVLALRYE
jgi:putative ABC transport system permease protein